MCRPRAPPRPASGEREVESHLQRQRAGSSMNLKLIAGIVLFVIGLAAAVAGIAGVGEDTVDTTSMVVEENRSQYLPDTVGKMVLPFVAALSLAVGGLLIGLSLGNWTRPRAHAEPGDEVVNPEGHHTMKHV